VIRGCRRNTICVPTAIDNPPHSSGSQKKLATFIHSSVPRIAFLCLRLHCCRLLISRSPFSSHACTHKPNSCVCGSLFFYLLPYSLYSFISMLCDLMLCTAHIIACNAVFFVLIPICARLISLVATRCSSCLYPVVYGSYHCLPRGVLHAYIRLCTAHIIACHAVFSMLISGCA
jgi:hypothetical protein